MQRALAMAARGFLNQLFPPVCVLCRAQVSDPGGLCASCWAPIQFIEDPCCATCGLPFDLPTSGETRCASCHAEPPAYDRARAVMRYDDASKSLVLALKHSDRLDLVPSFARWLERSGREFIARTDVVVPVPLHRRRLWHRRYNQSAELARALSGLCGKPLNPSLLVRTRATESQGAMPSASARRRNVTGAFSVPQSRHAWLRGRNVLLIDDVLTTGATVNACARALKGAGAGEVLVLALARVSRAS